MVRIVQVESGGNALHGVEVNGDVFATGYADTLSLIRAGERGLEQAAAAVGRGDPAVVDRVRAR